MPSLFDLPDTPIWQEKQFSWTGGEVNAVAPFLLKPDQAARLLNVQPLEVGGLRRRSGFINPSYNLPPNPGNAYNGLTLPAIDFGGTVTESNHGTYVASGSIDRDRLVRQGGHHIRITRDDLYPGQWEQEDPPHGAIAALTGPFSTAVGLCGSGTGATGTAEMLFLAQCVPSTNASLPYEPIFQVNTSDGGVSCVSLCTASATWPGSVSSTYSVCNYNLRARAVCWFQGRLWAFNCPNATEYHWGRYRLTQNTLVWSHINDGRLSNNYKCAYGTATGASGASSNQVPYTGIFNGSAASNWNINSVGAYPASSSFGIGGTLEIDYGTGDPGVAIVPVRDSVMPRLLLFKESSIYALDLYWATDGYFATTSDTLDFTSASLRPITNQTGMVGTLAGCWTTTSTDENGDFLFLSREGIRSLKRSSSDAQSGAGLPISYPIQKTIERINWKAAGHSVAVFWNNVAYFAVPVDGSTTNNLVIAYDTINGSWFELDMAVASWCPAKLSTTGSRALIFSPVWPASVYSNTSISIPTVCELSSGSEYDQIYGATETRAIPFEIQTRSYTFDQEQGAVGSGLCINKRWRHLELYVASSNTGATLTINYKTDCTATWTLLRNVYIDPTKGYSAPPVIDPNTQAKVVPYHISLTSVPPAKTIQFQLLDNNSLARYKLHGLAVYASPLNPKFYS